MHSLPGRRKLVKVLLRRFQKFLHVASLCVRWSDSIDTISERHAAIRPEIDNCYGLRILSMNVPGFVVAGIHPKGNASDANRAHPRTIT